MDIEEEIAAELRDTFNVCGDDPGCQCEYAIERSGRVARLVIMPLVRRAQAEALRSYRTRLMDQNIDRFGIVLPDLHEVLDDLDEEADRIEQEAGA